MTVAELTEPAVMWVPDGGVGSAGQEAVDLARVAGLELDGWQAFLLEHALQERPDGRWLSFEVGECIPRQNGKGGVLEARELAGLFLLEERLVIHSAHQFDTSLEAFRRLLFLIEQTPELEQRVKRVSRAHGEEGIELLSGQRIRFRTRTKGGGRGFTGDCLILDEAMILPEASHSALMPTLSARPNPQVWYAGSAVDQVIHPDGMVFARVRDRGVRGGDPALMYVEWNAGEYSSPGDVPAEVLDDEAAWAAANPALDIRISREHVARERRSMDPRSFAVERLNIGDWPDTSDDAGGVISMAVWRGLRDEASTITGPVFLAFDVSPDRSVATIAAAGTRADGVMHGEVVDRRHGTGWVAERVVEIADRHAAVVVVCDAASPAAALVGAVEDGGVTVTQVGSRDYAAACGSLFDLVDQGRFRHLGTGELENAVRGAQTRPLGDAWAWSRRSSRVDITPLVAVTLAAAGERFMPVPDQPRSWRPL